MKRALLGGLVVLMVAVTPTQAATITAGNHTIPWSAGPVSIAILTGGDGTEAAFAVDLRVSIDGASPGLLIHSFRLDEPGTVFENPQYHTPFPHPAAPSPPAIEATGGAADFRPLSSPRNVPTTEAVLAIVNIDTSQVDPAGGSWVWRLSNSVGSTAYSGTSTVLQDGTITVEPRNEWAGPDGGLWNEPGNWTNNTTVPNGIGDVANFLDTIGYDFQGHLEVGSSMVGLKDADMANVYETHLGALDCSPGALSSFNGIAIQPVDVWSTLDTHEGWVTGHGTVKGAVRFEVDGANFAAIAGDGPGKEIVLDGVVSGSGWLEYVQITGLHRPGASAGYTVLGAGTAIEGPRRWGSTARWASTGPVRSTTRRVATTSGSPWPVCTRSAATCRSRWKRVSYPARATGSRSSRRSSRPPHPIPAGMSIGSRTSPWTALGQTRKTGFGSSSTRTVGRVGVTRLMQAAHSTAPR